MFRHSMIESFGVILLDANYIGGDDSPVFTVQEERRVSLALECSIDNVSMTMQSKSVIMSVAEVRPEKVLIQRRKFLLKNSVTL